jgi:hypothetical protein
MAHAGDEDPQHPVARAILGVRLVEHGRLAAANVSAPIDQGFVPLVFGALLA